MVTITPKHLLDTTVAGNTANRKASLVEGGPLKANPEHWVNKCLDPAYLDRSGGDVLFDMHMIEYLFLNCFIWSERIKKRSMAWNLTPAKVSSFLAKADSLGLLPWDKVMQPTEMALLIARVARTMPDADRLLDEADVWASGEDQDDTAVFFYGIKPATLEEKSGGGMLNAIDLKLMLSDGYVRAGTELTGSQPVQRCRPTPCQRS